MTTTDPTHLRTGTGVPFSAVTVGVPSPKARSVA
jgi:hypothetical protein